MKNTNLTQYLVCLGIALATVTACKKTETITVQQPTACFIPLVTDMFSSFQVSSSSNYIDSNFYFHNCSNASPDSGAQITYSWDFGDGATSTEKSPAHKYSKRGNYKVVLTVSNKGLTADTMQQTVSVQLGQKYISFGDGVNIQPIAVEETAARDFVILGSSNYGGTCYLLQADSLLNLKNTKALPASYYLTSMQAAGDGNYIFTGSTQSIARGSELIKMKADGTLLWNKLLSVTDNNTYAINTSDGGYAAIGTRKFMGPFWDSISVAVVTKTDNNGNLQWQKLLNNEGMLLSSNAVVEQDGIVVAGVKQRSGSACSTCDSVMILKLDNAGNTIWTNTILWGANTSINANIRITKLANGNFAVIGQYQKAIFFFSPLGKFLDRKLALNQVYDIMDSGDGNLVVQQMEGGNGFRAMVSKLTPDGIQRWYAYPDGRQRIPNGSSCCSDSWPKGLRLLHNGEYLIVCDGVYNNSSNSWYHDVILFMDLNKQGKQQ
jgi:PKD repeat protein